VTTDQDKEGREAHEGDRDSQGSARGVDVNVLSTGDDMPTPLNWLRGRCRLEGLSSWSCKVSPTGGATLNCSSTARDW